MLGVDALSVYPLSSQFLSPPGDPPVFGTNVTLTVNGDGTTTSGFAAEGGDFTRVQSDDADTTRLYSPTSNDLRQFSLTDTVGLTGATINSVTVFVKYRSLDPVTNTMQINIRTGGVDYFSATKDTVNVTTYVLFSEVWALNPNTGVAWTVADLDALQTGIKKINSTGGAITYTYTVVNYTAAAGITGKIKYWNGTTFVAKPVKYWNGTTWATKPLKRWNGTTWVVTNY